MNKGLILMLCLGLIFCAPAEARRKKKKTEQPAAAAPAPKPSVERDGLFKVTKLKTDWFFEIPDSLIGRQFLTTTRYISTPANSGKFGGEQVNEQTVYWQVAPDDQLLLRANLIINVADTSQIINRAVTISNENPIIGSFKIESHKDNVYKIKVNQFFNEDNAAIALPTYVKKNYNLTGLVPNMSYIEDIKSFPMNTEVRLVKTWNSNSTNLPAVSATGRATFGLNISFILLPEKPMMRRYYDPRVGYFADSFNEFSDGQQRVQPKKFITRWRLEPKPEDVERMKRGELVEPQKPIVYYIDPATPKQWRKYLIQGVNDWQKAFEKAGFKNAIMAKEWPEGEDSIMSMEDARYSMIRYLASPIENAYGPNVHDPRTGEILESHICWYHNVMSLVHDWYMVQAASIDEAARKMNFDEELMGQLIRFVSSHEVGHTLGLRHNFGASSTVPVDSLRNKAWVEKYGHTPSIMDYARFNYVAQPEDGISRTGIFPRINDYDIWAIEWGYTPMWGATDEDTDHALLEKLVQERTTGKPRLRWGDGEGISNDPRNQTEDLGDDAMKASEYGILNLKRELKELPTWTYEESDIQNHNLMSMYNQIYSQFARYIGHVAQNVGGRYLDFKAPGQPGDIFTPTPRKKQKAAMEFLDRHVFNEPTWLKDISYANRITTDPDDLTKTMATFIARQMVNNRLSNLNKEYTADEFLTDLTKKFFKEADTRQKVTTYRATLQSAYVEALIKQYQGSQVSSTTRPFVLRTLKQLKTKCASAMNSGADSATRAHFANLNDVISRALEIKN